MKKKLLFTFFLVAVFFLVISAREVKAATLGCKASLANTGADGLIAKLRTNVYEPWLESNWENFGTKAADGLIGSFASPIGYSFTSSADDTKIINDAKKQMEKNLIAMEKTFSTQMVNYVAAKKTERCIASCQSAFAADKVKVDNLLKNTNTSWGDILSKIIKTFNDNNSQLSSDLSSATTAAAATEKCLNDMITFRYNTLAGFNEICTPSASSSLVVMKNDIKNKFKEKSLANKLLGAKDSCKSQQILYVLGNTPMAPTLNIAAVLPIASDLNGVKTECNGKTKKIYDEVVKIMNANLAACKS